jgi:hypothetical protein
MIVFEGETKDDFAKQTTFLFDSKGNLLKEISYTPSIYSTLTFNYQNTYDRSELLIEQIKDNSDEVVGKNKFYYDKNSNLVKDISHYGNDHFGCGFVMSYDELIRPVQISVLARNFDSSQAYFESHRNILIYDSKGQLIEESIYSIATAGIEIINHTLFNTVDYHDKKLIITNKFSYSDKNILLSCERISETYALLTLFDENRNPIKVVSDGKTLIEYKYIYDNIGNWLFRETKKIVQEEVVTEFREIFYH